MKVPILGLWDLGSVPASFLANAGICDSKGPIDAVDWNEGSKVIDIDLRGTVLRCGAVLLPMRKQQYGKIIMLSGGGATNPLPNLSTYAASKAAVVSFCRNVLADYPRKLRTALR